MKIPKQLNDIDDFLNGFFFLSFYVKQTPIIEASNLIGFNIRTTNKLK